MTPRVSTPINMATEARPPTTTCLILDLLNYSIHTLCFLAGSVRAVQRRLQEDLLAHPHLPLGVEGDEVAEPILLRLKWKRIETLQENITYSEVQIFLFKRLLEKISHRHPKQSGGGIHATSYTERWTAGYMYRWSFGVGSNFANGIVSNISNLLETVKSGKISVYQSLIRNHHVQRAFGNIYSMDSLYVSFTVLILFQKAYIKDICLIISGGNLHLNVWSSFQLEMSMCMRKYATAAKCQRTILSFW